MMATLIGFMDYVFVYTLKFSLFIQNISKIAIEKCLQIYKTNDYFSDESFFIFTKIIITISILVRIRWIFSIKSLFGPTISNNGLKSKSLCTKNNISTVLPNLSTEDPNDPEKLTHRRLKALVNLQVI